jgi:anaerobic selenocysteine-containing dehydrogenase
MAVHEAKSFCRICGGGCGMRLVLNEHDRLLELHPDPDHPMSHGYVCFKGLQAVDLYQNPERIIHTLKRNADGSVVRIGVEDALDEIAEKLIRIRAAHGAESIATFLGTAGYQAFTARPLMEAFRNALGTPANFTNNTIDQSSKLITAQRMGFWAAGKPGLEECDVVMLVEATSSAV